MLLVDIGCLNIYKDAIQASCLDSAGSGSQIPQLTTSTHPHSTQVGWGNLTRGGEEASGAFAELNIDMIDSNTSHLSSSRKFSFATSAWLRAAMFLNNVRAMSE